MKISTTTISVLLTLVLVGCDPYPSIRWYNAVPETIELKDGPYGGYLGPGTTAELIPGDADLPWVIVEGSNRWIYDKRLPPGRWETSKFVTFDSRRNTYIYTYQINPDGAITVVGDPFRLPAPRNSAQPEGFPLLPRFGSGNTASPANAIENINQAN